MTRRLILTAALIAALAPGVALAQTRRPSPGAQTPRARGLVFINGGLQSPGRTFTDAFSFERYREEGTLETTYRVDSAPFFDGGTGVRLWRALGVGVAFSAFSESGTAGVRADVPHPFFFDRPREVTGDATGIARNETAVHIQLLALVPAGRRVLVVLTGGPTVFTVEQSIVREVSYDESYPFDTATFRTAQVRRERERKMGFHAGVDLIVMLGRHVGVGGLVRLARATVDLTLDDGRTLAIEAGGVQYGGGLRVVFE